MLIILPLLTLGVVLSVVVWWWQRVFFYRDPVRHTPQGERDIVAPCDGTVIYAYRVEGGMVVANKLGRPIPVTELLKMDLPQPVRGSYVGIYMSPRDVHFNYAPVSGEVRDIHELKTGLNLPMVDTWEYLNLVWLNKWVNLFGNRYHFENERTTLWLRGRLGDVVMVEIADIFVDKITLFTQVGAWLNKGEKVSFIERGSQVDLLILGDDHEVLVQPGQHTTGGETVVARYLSHAGAPAR